MKENIKRGLWYESRGGHWVYITSDDGVGAFTARGLIMHVDVWTPRGDYNTEDVGESRGDLIEAIEPPDVILEAAGVPELKRRIEELRMQLSLARSEGRRAARIFPLEGRGDE